MNPQTSLDHISMDWFGGFVLLCFKVRFIFQSMCVLMCGMCICYHPCESRCQKRVSDSPGAEATYSCELPNIGAGK